jgi:hypothetical protein
MHGIKKFHGEAKFQNHFCGFAQFVRPTDDMLEMARLGYSEQHPKQCLESYLRQL